jgi:hypothetical protein
MSGNKFNFLLDCPNGVYNVNIEDINQDSIEIHYSNNKPINYVCCDCGNKFLSDRQKREGGAVTAHKSICGLCQQEKLVVSARHFNRLQSK